MVGIIVALKHEAEHVLNNMQNKTAIKIADKPSFKGYLGGKEVVLVVCGIGKVNSALATQAVIDKFSPSAILNFGTAGGFTEQVSPLCYYGVDKCCQYDFDLSELDNVPVGYIQDYDTVFFNLNTAATAFLPQASLASADRFTDKPEFISIIKQTGAVLRDMEGGAIAQVCKSNEIPFISVKGVTDVYGSGASGGQFYENLLTVCKGFPEIIEKTIAALV